MKNNYPIFLCLAIMFVFLSCKREWENKYDAKADISPESWAPMLQKVAFDGQYIIRLNWKNRDTDTEGIKIDRKAGDEDWEIGWEVLPSDQTSYNDTSLLQDPGLLYQYRIYAFAGNFSSTETEDTIRMPDYPPSAVYIDDLSDISYRISWSPPIYEVDGFRVDKRINSGEWKIGYAQTESNVDKFIDTNVYRETYLHYRVYAFIDDFESSKVTAIATAEIPVPSDPKLVQTNLKSIRYSWKDNSSGADAFVVWVSNYEIGLNQHPDTVYDTVYTRQDIKPFSKTTLSVCAIIGECRSYGLEEKITTTIPAVDNFTLEKQAVDKIKLSWEYESVEDVHGFIIQRKYDDGPWQDLTTTKELSFLDDDVDVNQDVSYRIAVKYNNELSEYEEQQTNTMIPAPVDFQIVKQDLCKINLNWACTQQEGNNFEIYRQYAGEDWALLSSTSDFEYLDDSFEMNKSINYRVLNRQEGYESNSVEKSTDSEIPLAELLSFQVLSATSVKLSWEYEYEDYESFVIDRKVGAEDWQIHYAEPNHGVFNYTDNTGINLDVVGVLYRIAVEVKGAESVSAYFKQVYKCGALMIDERDNKLYKTTQINNQCWMAENLDYRNDASRCYDDDNAMCDEYGSLYDWSAALNGEQPSGTVPSGVQGVCPQGWHLPSNLEWKNLTNYLGGLANAGAKLKETGTEHWDEPNTQAVDLFGFAAFGGGWSGTNSFNQLKKGGYWYTSTEVDGKGRYFFARYDEASLDGSESEDVLGFSIRCLRND